MVAVGTISTLVIGSVSLINATADQVRGTAQAGGVGVAAGVALASIALAWGAALVAVRWGAKLARRHEVRRVADVAGTGLEIVAREAARQHAALVRLFPPGPGEDR